jgi:serine/threonine-protein kinase RsbW
VRITLKLSLPRDEQTVSAARHIATKAMDEIGVAKDATDDLAVALTEACTNVLKHAGPGNEYEVRLDVEDGHCVIRVIDTGSGFDSRPFGLGHAAISAEQGRGIELIRALVDDVRFVSKPESGTIVYLEKRVEFADDSLVRRAGAPR